MLKSPKIYISVLFVFIFEKCLVTASVKLCWLGGRYTVPTIRGFECGKKSL